MPGDLEQILKLSSSTTIIIGTMRTSISKMFRGPNIRKQQVLPLRLFQSLAQRPQAKGV